MLEEQAPLASI